MFLSRLHPLQSVAFLSLAHEIVSSDSVSTVGEIFGLAEIRRELGIGAEDELELLSVDMAAEQMTTGLSRTVTLLELMRLSHADGHLSVHESGLINRLATRWRIAPAELDRIRSWSGRCRDLRIEGLELIGTSDD